MNFCIGHTIADIQYNCDGFLEKNKDNLKLDIVETIKVINLAYFLQSSTMPTISSLFENVKIEPGKIGKGQLIASKFILSLNNLMELINTTDPHFIRCLKPNDTKLPGDWDYRKVMNQLFSLSILEALQLKNLAYSFRKTHQGFVQQFNNVNLASLNAASR